MKRKLAEAQKSLNNIQEKVKIFSKSEKITVNLFLNVFSKKSTKINSVWINNVIFIANYEQGKGKCWWHRKEKERALSTDKKNHSE